MSYYESLDLTTDPFSTTSDPMFFYESKSHKQALNTLLTEINLRRGLIVILGDIGTGKTTLSQKLIQNLGEGFICKIILDPVYENDLDCLEALVRTLGVETTTLNHSVSSGAPLTGSKLKDVLQKYLFQKVIEENKTVVLIIDEAQKLSEPSLEVLRIFLNYEANQTKLCQLILLGQAELQGKLNNMPNLFDRISSMHVLTPLDPTETEKMIMFRLQQAGYKEKEGYFSSTALKEIYQYTQGYPRQITLLCHKALSTMVGQDRSAVDSKMIEEICEAEARKRMPLATKSSPTLVIPLQPQITGKTIIARKRNYLRLALVSMLGCAALAYVGVNYLPKIGSEASPPTQTDQNRPADTYYQTMINELNEEQNRTNNLITELTRFKNEIKDEFKNNQPPSVAELSDKMALLENAQESTRQKLSSITKEIAKVQSRVNEDNKELGTYLVQLKESFEKLDNKLYNLSGDFGKSSLLPGQAIPDGFYVIRILEAVITPTDWTDNDLGSKAAPPDCFIIVRQNDNDIFKSRVKPDTRNPQWNEEFILNWADNSKLEVVLYDLDGQESEKILSWDNSQDKGFLFKGNRLTASAGSYLSYEVFLTPIKKND